MKWSLLAAAMFVGTVMGNPVPDQLGTMGGRPADAKVLFDGTAASVAANWRADNGKPSKWQVVDGELEATNGAGNINTKAKYRDVQLHVEWKTPANATAYGTMNQGNSGVFFMDGTYEV